MRKIGLTLLLAVSIESVCADGTSEAATPLDKIDRSIAAEPKYQCAKPLYGLYVLDTANKTRIWAVLDKSRAAEKSVYDVLYFDTNGNGKLTDKGERFENASGRFEIGEFTDPNSGDTHTHLQLTHSSKGSVMLALDWKGKHKVRGGYATVPGPYTMFGGSPAEAPIVKMVGEGAFTFQTWMAPKALKIGDSGTRNDIKFFIGHAGVGANTFSSVMHPFLPEDVALEATLVYETASGETAEATTKLTSRC